MFVFSVNITWYCINHRNSWKARHHIIQKHNTDANPHFFRARRTLICLRRSLLLLHVLIFPGQLLHHATTHTNIHKRKTVKGRVVRIYCRPCNTHVRSTKNETSWQSRSPVDSGPPSLTGLTGPRINLDRMFLRRADRVSSTQTPHGTRTSISSNINTSYQKLPSGSGDDPDKLFFHQALN